MPQTFRSHFQKCVCFEVFCDRQSDLKDRAQTYSNYTHHNTIKFLIAISTQGVISFLSKGWGERVSDKPLTEKCGILANLLPGDQVLADRGFTIVAFVGYYCAELKIPPFTRGKRQLQQVEVDEARQLSRVRIHIKRVIRLVRSNFRLLKSTLPINSNHMLCFM